jgi:hypothetical protein
MYQESATFARLVYRLSDDGILDAAEKGVRTGSEVHFTVDSSEDPDLWKRTFALNPVPVWEQVEWGEPQVVGVELPIGRWRTVHFINQEPEDLDGWGLPDDVWVWDEPRIEVTVSEDPVSLSRYLSAEQLIDYEEDRRRVAASVEDVARTGLDRLHDNWHEWSRTTGLDSARRLRERAVLISPSNLAYASRSKLGRALKDLDTVISMVEKADPTDELLDLGIGHFAGVVRENYDRLVELSRESEGGAAKEAELAEALEWVPIHGSARLNKALAAGLLASSMGVYRDERLGAERPGWFWWNAQESLKSVINPREDQLDALLEAREWDEKARLVFSPSRAGIVLMAKYLGREIALDVSKGDEEPF